MKKADGQKVRRAFCWQPGTDTLLALITVAVMLGVYYCNTRFGFDHPWVFFLVFLLLGNVLLNVFFPAYVVLSIRCEGLDGLGITRRRLVTSLILSALLAAFSLPAFLAEARKAQVDIIPHLVFNGIILWEVLFVYGWLQLRFERAFGFVAAPLLAGISFGIYHIGSLPVSQIPFLMAWGVFFGTFFAFTRNVFTLIPFAWAVSSGIGTISVGFVAGWADVLVYSVVLVLQVMGIAWFARLPKQLPAVAEPLRPADRAADA